MYEAENPGKRVCVIDSLSAGPELVLLLLEKLEQLAEEGLPFEEICSRIEAYKQNTGLAFMLASLKNFAAHKLKALICARLAQVDVQIHRCRGLCSYYAEKGGLLVGFEKL